MGNGETLLNHLPSRWFSDYKEAAVPIRAAVLKLKKTFM